MCTDTDRFIVSGRQRNPKTCHLPAENPEDPVVNQEDPAGGQEEAAVQQRTRLLPFPVQAAVGTEASSLKLLIRMQSLL